MMLLRKLIERGGVPCEYHGVVSISVDSGATKIVLGSWGDLLKARLRDAPAFSDSVTFHLGGWDENTANLIFQMVAQLPEFAGAARVDSTEAPESTVLAVAQ